MARLVVGPFNRVEGDLEVTLEVRDGVVESARVSSPMYRGFEQILRGKDPGDALVLAPRVCGICSVSQSLAAALALADLAGLVPARNGRIVRNLAHAVENLTDHLTHFYVFFMPDFARPVYAHRPWHARALARFRALHGAAADEVLPARTAFLEAMGTLIGKWPHTLALQPGGVSRALEPGETIRLARILREFRGFLERTVFGDTLEVVATLDGEAALARWLGGGARGDFGLFLEIAADLGLGQLGPGPGRFLSYGAYLQDDGPLWQRGVWERGPQPLDSAAIREDVSHSWFAGSAPLHPAAGDTEPFVDKHGGYSWCKAPRLDGRPVETGALARQQVQGHPLIRELVAASGGNVRNRVIARLLELAALLPRLEQWVQELAPGEPYCAQAGLPRSGRGVGLTEAARGSLGHWLEVADGRIRNYQIISPTTWNFSPRDAAGMPGPLEQALVGTPVEPGEPTPVAVQHVVRSFDPCMVCTVH